MKVILTAKQKFDDYALLDVKLTKLFATVDKKKLTVVLGRGDPVSHLAEIWCFKNYVIREVHSPEQSKGMPTVEVMHEKMAMTRARHVIVFGEDEGNRGLIVRAKKWGSRVRVIDVRSAKVRGKK